MAASQKKTGGKRTSSGGTRRSGSASGSSRGNSRGSKAPARRPMRREIGAAVCLALALFAALGYFHIQAIFIDFFSGLLKGLLGYGFWLMPPALLLAAYILAFHRGRPVRLRVTCALLLPLLFSCIVHGLLGRVLPWDAALVKTLWAAGEELTSGGNPDYIEREDGFGALCQTYGLEFGDVVDIDIGLKYQALASGDIDVTNAFTTDAQLANPDTDLVTLADDKHLQVNYFCSTVVRQDALEKFPGLEDVLLQMDGILTDQEMASLNYQVEVEGLDEQDVARDFLTQKGLLEA